MNKRILNEVKRNRELMGINESELDEQGFLRGVKDGIKKGYEITKSSLKKKKGTLDGTSEDVEITYNIGPKFTVFKYDTKGAINGHFMLVMELEKLGLDVHPDYYEGTVSNTAKYKIPNEKIPETFFGDEDIENEDIENEESENNVFTITYEGKEYKVDKDTLLNKDNLNNSYIDIDGVRFYYVLTNNQNFGHSDLINKKAKDIKKGDVINKTVTKTTDDDGSTNTVTNDREILNTTLSNGETVVLVHISPDTIEDQGIVKGIVIGL